MSYGSANDPRDLYALLVVFIAMGGVLAWRVRRENGNPGDVVAHCADGTVIGAWRRGVRHRAPRRTKREAPPRPADARLRRLREDLEPGDLQYVRIREAREGESGWFVEGMDGESSPFRLCWRFESTDEAVAALRVLQDRIVRAPEDSAGREIALTDPEFDARWFGAAGSRSGMPTA